MTCNGEGVLSSPLTPMDHFFTALVDYGAYQQLLEDLISVLAAQHCKSINHLLTVNCQTLHFRLCIYAFKLSAWNFLELSLVSVNHVHVPSGLL